MNLIPYNLLSGGNGEDRLIWSIIIIDLFKDLYVSCKSQHAQKTLSWILLPYVGMWGHVLRRSLQILASERYILSSLQLESKAPLWFAVY